MVGQPSIRPATGAPAPRDLRLWWRPADPARLVRPFQQATISLGEPILVDGPAKSTNRTRRELTDRFMAEIARLCDETYVDEYATLHLG